MSRGEKPLSIQGDAAKWSDRAEKRRQIKAEQLAEQDLRQIAEAGELREMMGPHSREDGLFGAEGQIYNAFYLLCCEGCKTLGRSPDQELYAIEWSFSHPTPGLNDCKVLVDMFYGVDDYGETDGSQRKLASIYTAYVFVPLSRHEQQLLVIMSRRLKDPSADNYLANRYELEVHSLRLKGLAIVGEIVVDEPLATAKYWLKQMQDPLRQTAQPVGRIEESA